MIAYLIMKIVRSQQMNIKVTKEQAAMLEDTLSQYRGMVRALMLLINAQWKTLQHCKEKDVVRSVEALMHPTKKRPLVKHRYFQSRFFKFPSYLRRVAINYAYGQVSSFQTRYDDWLINGYREKRIKVKVQNPKKGEQKYRQEVKLLRNKPPTLNCETKAFPSLYGGQCIRYSEDRQAAEIKVFHKKDWIWIKVQLTGKTRFNGLFLSPTLVQRNKRFYLSEPVKSEIQLKSKKQFSGKVLAVDSGINTTAVCAVVDKDGTVHDRFFIDRSDKDRENKRCARIAKAARQYTRHNHQSKKTHKLPKGFCAHDYERLRHLASNQAHHISKQIVQLALKHGCDAIVFEDLKGWKPKAGRKGGQTKQNFHRWHHRMLHDRVKSKAEEKGLRFIDVFARGTSSEAHDGSGKVVRDKDNYSLCTLQSKNSKGQNKRYHADLNASYNIAARGILKLYHPELCKLLWDALERKSPSITRNPWILATLWNRNAIEEQLRQESATQCAA